MKKILFMISIIGVLLLSLASVHKVVADPPEFVTICHAAGLQGTTQFVTLTLPYVAVYGEAGHFNENGTPRAGHEQDYLGECVTPTPTPTPSGSPTPTPSGSPTPTPSGSPTPTPSGSPTPTPTPTPEVTPTPTPTSTQTPGIGGPGDGSSDNLGCGSHDCSGNTVSSQGQVLGASTGPQVLGLSTTSGESETALPFIQLVSAFGFTSLGFGLFRKHA